MEQLTCIRITDKGEVNEVATIKFNEQYGQIKHKDIVRRHLTRIIGFLFGMKVKVYYEFKEPKHEQPGTN